MQTVSFDEFKKLEIRIGTITSAEFVQGSDKLLRLLVDTGEGRIRQIIAGIARFVSSDGLVGKQCPFVLNLETKEIMGNLSEGMMLAIDDAGALALLHPSRKVKDGSSVR